MSNNNLTSHTLTSGGYLSCLVLNVCVDVCIQFTHKAVATWATLRQIS